MGEQLVALSPRRIWAIAGDGRLLATSDGGQVWRRVAVPTPAVALTSRADRVWAVTCRHVAIATSPLACRLQLWQAPIATGAWAQVSLPALTAQAPEYLQLAISTHGTVLLDLLTAGRRVGGELAIGSDAGSWRVRPTPRWDGRPCLGADLTSFGPSSFWLLCLGEAAAGSSTKDLLESTDAGSTWSSVSAATSLSRPPSPGSIPLAEPSALSAGSTQRLWLALTNGLVESDDSGRTWSDVSTARNPGGWPTVITVLDANHAWMLAPGAGLWRTTDGSCWTAIGPLNTS